MHINNITVFSSLEFANYLKDKQIYQKVIKTPAGMLLVQATDDGIFQTTFVEHDSTHCDATIKLDSVLLVGTPFQLHVWRELLKIKRGMVCTYQELAIMLGMPRAYRAVANALSANKIAYFVPCHRVKRTDGELGGFAWGIERKKLLLNAEI